MSSDTPAHVQIRASHGFAVNFYATHCTTLLRSEFLSLILPSNLLGTWNTEPFKPKNSMYNITDSRKHNWHWGGTYPDGLRKKTPQHTLIKTHKNIHNFRMLLKYFSKNLDNSWILLKYFSWSQYGMYGKVVMTVTFIQTDRKSGRNFNGSICLRNPKNITVLLTITLWHFLGSFNTSV